MRSRLALAGLVLSLLWMTGASCSGPGITVTPAEGEIVSAAPVAIRIELEPATFDEATLVATLNGTPLALAGGPASFSADVPAGGPLLDDNLLHVRARALNGVEVSLDRHFRFAPPGKARVRRIDDASQLVRGPLGHSRVGDWVLENDRVRFAIQDVAKRDLYSVGQYGGNLIDAEVVGRPDRDNFLEIQPSINVETVINAQTLQVVNDGQNGLPAVIRTCGPDDILDFVNVSTILSDRGFPIPPGVDDRDYEVEGCTEYTLAPGQTRMQLVTTVYNAEPVPRGFYIGDYVSGSGELDQWTPPLGLGEPLVNNLTGIYYEGVGEAQGVSYGHVPIPVPGSSIPDSTFLSTSGVTYLLQSHSVFLIVLLQQPPTFVVPASGSRSYERWFTVGDGSGAAGIDLENAVRSVVTGEVQGCVTVGGQPREGAKVSIGDVAAGKLTTVRTHFVTDATGCWRGTLKPGAYGVATARTASLYETNLPAPTVHPLSVVAGQTTTAPTIDLPAPARLHVTVTDESGAPVPARVSAIGADPSPEPLLVLPGGFGLPDIVTGTFGDAVRDSFPFGVFAHHYAGADGIADFEVEPGDFGLVVSRGGEYSRVEQTVSLVSGQTTHVSAQIARVVDTTGFISSDYHVHGIRSSDSRVNDRDRVLQYAGEGVDNVIMTDHHVHTDLTPRIASLGMTPFLRATVGEEITTWDYGHFNAYPLLVDPARPSGGSTDWAKAAPPGRDFPAYGAYNATPAELYELAVHGAQSTPDTAIQINHIGSFFSPLRIDTSLVPPQSFITAAKKLEFRLDPSTGNLFHHFPALELWNGSDRGAQGTFLGERIGIWFNHLNQGLRTTFIADTDTHEFFSLGGAGARTWTAASTDAPAAIDPGEMARSVKAGKATGGQGVFVQTRLLAADGSGRVADLTLGGSTDVTSDDGDVDLEIRVQSPEWAEWDRIEIYANAATVVTGTSAGTPVSFSATPTRVLERGTDFVESLVDVHPGVPGARRRELVQTVSFPALAQDTWFVVVVKGRDGISRPMFPVHPDGLRRTGNATPAQLLDGNLGESGTLALGATNALYADVDGVPGFQPPWGTGGP